jgi:hypothetical protein
MRRYRAEGKTPAISARALTRLACDLRVRQDADSTRRIVAIHRQRLEGAVGCLERLVFERAEIVPLGRSGRRHVIIDRRRDRLVHALVELFPVDGVVGLLGFAAADDRAGAGAEADTQADALVSFAENLAEDAAGNTADHRAADRAGHRVGILVGNLHRLVVAVGRALGRSSVGAQRQYAGNGAGRYENSHSESSSRVETPPAIVRSVRRIRFSPPSGLPHHIPSKVKESLGESHRCEALSGTT